MINEACNCGIDCKCMQTQDFDKNMDIINVLDNDLMSEFSEK